MGLGGKKVTFQVRTCLDCRLKIVFQKRSL